MGSDEDRKGIRIYRSARVRHWRLSFHPGDVHSLFDELIHRRWGRAKWQPNIDVLKTTTGYVVEVDLPGVDEESIGVTVRGRYLSIEGRRLTGRSEGRAAVVICERPEGPFARIVQFGEIIEGFRVQKSVAKGVLTLVLTKA